MERKPRDLSVLQPTRDQRKIVDYLAVSNDRVILLKAKRLSLALWLKLQHPLRF